MPRIQPQEVKWNQDNSLDAVPFLTEEDKELIKKRLQEMEKLLQVQKKAKYKIELMFLHARSTWKPTQGVLNFWESGTKFHGGGDSKIYLCPGRTLGRSDCDSFIGSMAQGYSHLVCGKCGITWQGHEVHGEIIANHTMRRWAEIIYTYFRKLDFNADIYLKHSPDDLRSVAMMEQAKQLHGEKLGATRNKRALHFYPLANIIKDTSNGSDPLSRFHAFLTA